MISSLRNALVLAGALASLLLAAASLGQGAIDVYTFEDGQSEQRYRDLIARFRCPKCLNTNLAGSDAPIAADLRREVHDLVLEGKTNQQIRDFLQHRYGDFVLYDPPLKPTTWLLWFGPLLLLAGGAWLIFRISRAQPSDTSGDILTREERDRLYALTGDKARSRD